MDNQHKTKRILVKILKIFGWIFFSLVILLIVIALAIQLPSVQTRITKKAISFLEKKIGTEVSLDKISIAFPKSIVLNGLYLEDQKKDTLLYAGEVSIDTDLWALTQHEIQLNEINLENCKAYISRPERDSAYNFSYILKAFAGDSTAAPDTLQAGWKFSIEDIQLKKINAKYHDLLTGNIVDLNLGEFDVSISEFDLDHMKIVVDEITLKDTRTNVTQTKLPEVTVAVAEEKNPITYDIGVGVVNLENIHANYNQKALGQLIRLDLGKSVLKTEKIDLKLQRIDLDEFSLHNTFISYQQRKTAESIKLKNASPPVVKNDSSQNEAWKISLNELDLAGNSLQIL